MKLSEELKDCRMTIVRAAELAGLHQSHFRRLISDGVFPKPKRTATGQPYFDFEGLTAVATVMRTGIGQNGREVMFYRRRSRPTASKTGSARQTAQNPADSYLASLSEALGQLGIPKERRTPDRLKPALKALFGEARPELEQALPIIARHLLG